ncbi:stage II sporulation protein M [Staphylococcus sp. SQ8-PEA]|uniref:Stage II sporulation protein M n=1 Tax=Staphylococcus marylandisciuri TaxID=2981529 RepID=A0ABT2QST0_9STAP|nr:stage II sporulation protein M [Staphylococcus marylandisciuri]MCU5747046.1 stage II sporulation protein M [Staphylococcus marylandisciuri]
MLNIKDQKYFERALKTFIIVTTLLLITIILAFFFHPTQEFIKELSLKSPKRVSETHGLTKVWGFIKTNGFFVPIQMFILSLIPIPFLYTLNLIATVVVPGIMFGFFINFNTYKGLTHFIAFIPHYTFEVMSYCIIVSGLYMLNKSLTQKISNLFRKEKKYTYSFKTSLLNLLKTYLFICLPLVILAAFTETYIADFLANLMN